MRERDAALDQAVAEVAAILGDALMHSSISCSPNRPIFPVDFLATRMRQLPR